jgi:murein DD-endopeptidase MepM/ murein hydrolase activator NlpD
VRNFGTKDEPKYDPHYGFDIGCTQDHYNKPVFTPADGIVELVRLNRRGSSAGNYIVINHQNGFKTYYMHLNAILVAPGQKVSAGCQIATIGYTGGAKAYQKQFANVNYPVMRKEISHLHYEIHYNGSAESVKDANNKTIQIVHKFENHKSVDPAYFMGIK